jgi:hypothetical protein
VNRRICRIQIVGGWRATRKLTPYRKEWGQPACGLNADLIWMIGIMLNACLPQIQGRRQRGIGPTARLSERLRRYVKSRLTGNAAAGNAYNVADMASLLQAVRNAGANNVLILGASRTRATSRSGWPW